MRRAAGAGTWCAPEAGRRDVGRRRRRARTSSGSAVDAGRRRLRREERRLLPARREDRRVASGTRWSAPGGDQGGFEWGTAYDGTRIYASITNQHHLPYNLTKNGVAHLHDGHRRLLDGARPGDREDPLADRRPADRDPAGSDRDGRRLGPGAGHGRERRRLRSVDGEVRQRDVRARRGERADPLAVPGGQLGERRAGRRRRLRLLGLRLLRAAEGRATTGCTRSASAVSSTRARRRRRSRWPDAPNGSNGWYTSPVGVSVTATDGTRRRRLPDALRRRPADAAGELLRPAGLGLLAGPDRLRRDAHGGRGERGQRQQRRGAARQPDAQDRRTAPTIVAAPTTQPNATAGTAAT